MTANASVAGAAVARRPGGGAGAVRPPSGREVAELAEALYLRLFVVALGGMQIVCVMAIVAALARTSNAHFARTMALAVALAAIATLVVQNRERCYRALRRRPALSLAGPVLAVGALVADGVGHSPLSYPAAVSIAVPAFVCGRRWALAAAVLISAGALTGAWWQDGLSALNSVGQGTIGYFIWAIVLAGLAELFAPLAMRMPHVSQQAAAAPHEPLRVANLAGDPPPAAGAVPGEGAATASVREPARAADRLTGRQLQVVALLADGLRAEEIAQQLGIATSSVYRCIQRAKTRAGVASRSELIAIAVREGLLRQHSPAP